MLKGKDAAGRTRIDCSPRARSAINYAFAVADVGFVKALSVGTYKTLREAARVAKTLATPEQAKALIQSIRQAIIAAPQAGREAQLVLTRLGDVTDPQLTLWVKALGFSEAEGRAYGQLMRNAVRGSPRRERRKRRAAAPEQPTRRSAPRSRRARTPRPAR